MLHGARRGPYHAVLALAAVACLGAEARALDVVRLRNGRSLEGEVKEEPAKYVMLGYEGDVGHAEAVSLISQPKYAEKQVGYMVTSVILNESNDFLRMAINSVRNDVVSLPLSSATTQLALRWRDPHE